MGSVLSKNTAWFDFPEKCKFYCDWTTDDFYQDDDPVLRQSLKVLQGAELYSRTRKLPRAIQLDKRDCSQVTALHRVTPLSLTAVTDPKTYLNPENLFWVTPYRQRDQNTRKHSFSGLMVLHGFKPGIPSALWHSTCTQMHYSYRNRNMQTFFPFTEPDIAIKNINWRKVQYHCKDNFIQLYLWHLVSSDKFRLGGDTVI